MAMMLGTRGCWRRLLLVSARLEGHASLLKRVRLASDDQAIPLREPTMADRPMPHDSPRRRLAASDPAPTPLASPAQTNEEGVFVYDLYYKIVGGVADTDLGNVGAL